MLGKSHRSALKKMAIIPAKAGTHSARESSENTTEKSQGVPAFAGMTVPKLQSFPLKSGLALAVSGGSDSMALLRLVAAHRADFPHTPIAVLTVDHDLRAASSAEAEQVAAWCAALNLPHATLKWQGSKPATGLQAAARRARYDLMTQWCVANHHDTLLTAHTADDQAETVVMRQARTQSPHSLAAIWPTTLWNGITVMRPLLHERRENLRRWLRQLGQAWIDDPSNADPRFERVRIRAALREADVSALNAIADANRKQSRHLREEAAKWCAANAVISRFGHAVLSRPTLVALPPDMRLEVLRRLLLALGGGTAGSMPGLQRLVSDLGSGLNLRRTLWGAVIAARTRDILLGREAGRIIDTGSVPTAGQVLWDGRFWVMAPAGAHVRAAGAMRPPQGHDLPAFVMAALPLVEIPGHGPIFPHFEGTNGCGVTPSERFWA
jgi:tRNA(Ile)-lysidine synthase